VHNISWPSAVTGACTMSTSVYGMIQWNAGHCGTSLSEMQ